MEFLLVGRVRRAHGIRGELVVEALTDAPDAIFAPGRRVFAGTTDGAMTPDRQELHVHHSSPFKGGLIVGFDGIADRTSAEAWRDRYLLVPEDEVEPPSDDELFIHDLVGMRVVHKSGETVGEVIEVFELPQGPIMDVLRAQGTVMIPFDDVTVTSVDAEQRTITIDPVEGLLD